MKVCEVCDQPIPRSKEVCETCESSLSLQEGDVGFSQEDFEKEE